MPFLYVVVEMRTGPFSPPDEAADWTRLAPFTQRILVEQGARRVIPRQCLDDGPPRQSGIGNHLSAGIIGQA
jgi:hypothetical protein